MRSQAFFSATASESLFNTFAGLQPATLLKRDFGIDLRKIFLGRKEKLKYFTSSFFARSWEQIGFQRLAAKLRRFNSMFHIKPLVSDVH